MPQRPPTLSSKKLVLSIWFRGSRPAFSMLTSAFRLCFRNSLPTVKRLSILSVKREWITFGISHSMAPRGHQMTNFCSEQIVGFAWSPDGKTLGVLRQHTESDV